MDSRDEPSLSRATRLGSRPLRGWGRPPPCKGAEHSSCKDRASPSLVAIAIPNEDYGEGGVVLYSRRRPARGPVATHLVGEVSTLPAITGANRECTNGKVQIFDCNQVDLMSFLAGFRDRRQSAACS